MRRRLGRPKTSPITAADRPERTASNLPPAHRPEYRQSLAEFELYRGDANLLDKELDTYVVWNAREGCFLAFDKESSSWHPLP